MKIVITTQYRENYGAHDWDGKGQCPQYWKCKGGEIYIVENLTLEQANQFLESEVHNFYKLIEYKSDYAQEYVTSTQGYDDEEKVCDDWETPNIITMTQDGFLASIVTKNDEYGYMHKHILEKRESFIMKEEGKRDRYSVEFLLQDGKVVDSDNICYHLK